MLCKHISRAHIFSLAATNFRLLSNARGRVLLGDFSSGVVRLCAPIKPTMSPGLVRSRRPSVRSVGNRSIACRQTTNDAAALAAAATSQRHIRRRGAALRIGADADRQAGNKVGRTDGDSDGPHRTTTARDVSCRPHAPTRSNGQMLINTKRNSLSSVKLHFHVHTHH